MYQIDSRPAMSPRAALAALAISIIAAACGGGGSDGGGDGGNNGAGTLQYNGNANAAAISATNAGALANMVFSDGSNAQNLVIAGATGSRDDNGAPQSAGAAGMAVRLSDSLRSAVSKLGKPRNASSLQINDTLPCDNGVGTMRLTGTLSDTNQTGSVLVRFSSCLSSGITLDGPVTLNIVATSGGAVTDATYSFGNLSVRATGVNSSLAGTLRAQSNPAATLETLTINTITQDHLASTSTKTEDMVVTTTVSSSIAYQTINGRIYHSAFGYVDITTPVQMIFPPFNGMSATAFPAVGQVKLAGAGQASVLVTAESSTRARIEVDTNGDSTPEMRVALNWIELNGLIGSDFGDTDADGMPNGWERHFSLNPDNPSDASTDVDSDGAPNLVEFSAGTLPNSAFSVPPSTDLSLTLMATPNPVAATGGLTLRFVASNPPGIAAPGVVLTYILPAGASFVSATPDQGSCSTNVGTTTTLTCNLGTLPSGFTNINAYVIVVPASEGVLSHTATVTTDAFDRSLANNSATANVTVTAAPTTIQERIDAALPGATILVAPGEYSGPIYFRGKNVTLQSTGGPATTIIRGATESAVDMGPGGALKGFTVYPGQTSGFGAGISLHGAGSVVSDNVFVGIVPTGGAQSLIEINTASPLIERNVFRDMNCSDSLSTGVISAVNVSEPTIANNVFMNNNCQAVSLSLQAGLVTNNTFRGNRTAVRVARWAWIGDVVFRNNLIVGNDTGVDFSFGSDSFSPVWENNLVFGNTTDYAGTASRTGNNGNVSADPLFVDAAAGNFRLQSGSPAIDAGSAAGAPIIDIDGTSRPRDGNGDGTAAVDIGAYERP